MDYSCISEGNDCFYVDSIQWEMIVYFLLFPVMAEIKAECFCLGRDMYMLTGIQLSVYWNETENK